MSKKYPSSSNEPGILNDPPTDYAARNYYALAQQMVSKKYIKQVISLSRLSLTDFITLIPVSIDSYKRKTLFAPPVTEKVLEIEEVYRRGLNAFGEGIYSWMEHENIAMGGITPKQLLSNSFGIRRLLEQFGRMEHGVLA